MADTNTYDLFQKVEKWTTKDNFNKLDPRTIATGTEYNLTGAIDENDLASNLQTKINEISNKLTAPTTPTADSAVTMLADGTVGTKLLSEIGGKLYLHKISILEETSASNYIFYLYNRISTNMTLNDIAGRYFVASITGGMYKGTVSCIIEPSTTEGSTHKLKADGVVTFNGNSKVLNLVAESNGMMFTDTVTEL